MTFVKGTSGNPQGRPVGSINKQLAMLRHAVEVVLPLVVQRAVDGDVDAQRLILEKGLPKFKPIDAPMEFALPEAGEKSPERAILVQAAAGELSLAHAEKLVYDLLPAVAREEKALERKAQPAGFMNAYLASVMRG